MSFHWMQATLEALRNKFLFTSTKTFDFNLGLSAAFRQWAAASHCRFVHGYSLRIRMEFSGPLDKTNWVVDFGSMKSLKGTIEDSFDHKYLVAYNDPHIEYFREGHRLGVLDLVEVPATGCELFAAIIFEVTEQWLKDAGYSPRVTLDMVEVSEHTGNSAIARLRGEGSRNKKIADTHIQDTNEDKAPRLFDDKTPPSMRGFNIFDSAQPSPRATWPINPGEAGGVRVSPSMAQDAPFSDGSYTHSTLAEEARKRLLRSGDGAPPFPAQSECDPYSMGA